jgi:dolichol-phosphate mannosyltransferase
MEGDNTSRHELVQIMLNRAVAEDYEVVLASPYMYGGGIINTNSWRVLLSKVANLFVKEILGIQGIITASSFFRLYRAPAIKRLQQRYGDAIIERVGFECMVELLIKMINLRLRISEVPMVLDTSLRTGKSKMKVWRTIRGYIALFFRLRDWQVQPAASGPTSSHDGE